MTVRALVMGAGVPCYDLLLIVGLLLLLLLNKIHVKNNKKEKQSIRAQTIAINRTHPSHRVFSCKIVLFSLDSCNFCFRMNI